MAKQSLKLQPPPTCYRSLSGPSGPKYPGSVPRVSPGPFGPRAPECPESVPRVSPECPGHLFDTPGTLSGHFFGHSGGRGPKAPRDTPRDTPRTLRARRARETPVAGRGGVHSLKRFLVSAMVIAMAMAILRCQWWHHCVLALGRSLIVETFRRSYRDPTPPEPDLPLRHRPTRTPPPGPDFDPIWTRTHPPVLPFLAFVEKGRENHQKSKDFFFPTEPLKCLEKKGKTLKKNKEILASRKTRNSKKNKERKDRAFSGPNQVDVGSKSGPGGGVRVGRCRRGRSGSGGHCSSSGKSLYLVVLYRKLT